MNLEEILKRKKSNDLDIKGLGIRVEDLFVTTFNKKMKKDKVLLSGISTSIKKATITAIVGPSGCGKTTLINFLSGRQFYYPHFKNFGRYFINNF